MAYLGAGVTRFNTADELTVTGDAQIDGTTLVVDSTNNRVGVAKASPTTALDVSGTVTATAYAGDGSSLTGINTDLVDDTTPQLGGNLDLNSNDITGTGDIDITGSIKVEAATPEITVSSTTLANLATIKFTSGGADVDSKITHQANTGVMTIDSGRSASWGGKIAFVTDTSERMRIDNSGNVGIGTTSPSQKLHVYGGSVLIDNGSSAGTIYFHDTTNYINLSSDELQFANNGSERMRIDSSGNVGIGTANPTSALTVDGHVKGFNSFNDASYEIAARIGAGTEITGTNDPYLDMRRWTGSGTNHGSGSIAVDTGANMRFQTNAGVSGPATSERMRIDSSGNVGIGTTSPSNPLHVFKSSAGTIAEFRSEDGTNNPRFSIYGNSSGTHLHHTWSSGAGNLIFEVGGSAGSNEMMRIDSSGRLLVGTTDTALYNNTSGDGFVYDAASGSTQMTRDSGTTLFVNRSTTTGTAVAFHYNGTAEGSISVTASGTTYNTTSDIRLKTDIEPIEHATDMLMAMNPVSHRWKADPDADAVVGFIAQEMQEIVPEAVSGDADSDEMMSMDYGRITPVLVAALQDAHNKIEQLEQRIADMENN